MLGKQKMELEMLQGQRPALAPQRDAGLHAAQGLLPAQTPYEMSVGRQHSVAGGGAPHDAAGS
eukprot:gene1155-8995_t